MRQFKLKERERAIERGLEFIYGMACDKESFEEFGHDLINFFYFVSTTSSAPALRRSARKMGLERARHWFKKHSTLPRRPEIGIVSEYIHGIYATDRFGLRNPALKEQLREAVKRITALEYFYFDPVTEPPPSDATEPCEECGLLNERGRKTCSECRKRLVEMNRYGVWYDALIATYNCERVGIRIGGVRFLDVLKWLPGMRPYRGPENGDNPDFYDTLYAITHIVYTLNDYNRYRLSPRWLPQEYAFLKGNLQAAIEAEDPDMMGEFLDTLRAFGLESSHPLIRTGVDFLLSCQNTDGSWGDMDVEDVYGRYHPTWTAIDGLREYAWRGERLSFPKLMPVIQTMNKLAEMTRNSSRT